MHVYPTNAYAASSRARPAICRRWFALCRNDPKRCLQRCSHSPTRRNYWRPSKRGVNHCIRASQIV